MANTKKEPVVSKEIEEQVQDRTPVISTTPTKSKRLVSFQEFVSGNNFTPEFLAGFKMYLRVNKIPLFTDDKGWKDTLEAYKNRKL